MNTAFYRLWLPLSVVAHVVLLVILGVIRLPMPHEKTDGGWIDIIPVVEAAPVANPDRVIPPPVIPDTTLAIHQGVPNPKHANGQDPKEGVIPERGKGGESTAPGKGEGRKAPPALITGNHNPKWSVPPGTPNGTGTQGTEGAGEEGPSYGAAMKGGNHGGGFSKKADELKLSGQVLLRVSVNADGALSELRITNSSGSDILDSEALRLVRQEQFTAARQGGAMVTGTVRIRVTFTFGTNPFIEEVK
jgi:TonB family protein